MFFRKVIGLFIILLLLGAFFGAGRRSEYAAGFAQGYAAGQQADGAPAPAPVPYNAGIGLLGYCFRGFAFLFIILALMKLFFGHGRRHSWKRRHDKWQRGPDKWKGSHPWHDFEEETPVMKA